MDTPIFLVGEDALCCALGAALLRQSGVFQDGFRQAIKGGAGPFQADVARMNNIARRLPVLMIADGDQDKCVVSQLHSWLPSRRSPKLLLRLAVREAESWILADNTGFANFTELNAAKLPRNPDDLEDPKQTLLTLISKSRRRVLRDEMLPARHSRSKLGLGYNQHMEDFVRNVWDAGRAAERSPSLARAIPRIRALLKP